jgi:hypothetical protein
MKIENRPDRLPNIKSQSSFKEHPCHSVEFFEKPSPFLTLVEGFQFQGGSFMADAFMKEVLVYSVRFFRLLTASPASRKDSTIFSTVATSPDDRTTFAPAWTRSIALTILNFTKAMVIATRIDFGL